MNYSEKMLENFYKIQKQQNLAWELIDNGLMVDENETPKNIRKKKKAIIELAPIYTEDITYVDNIDVDFKIFGKQRKK